MFSSIFFVDLQNKQQQHLCQKVASFNLVGKNEEQKDQKIERKFSLEGLLKQLFKRINMGCKIFPD